MAPSRGTRCLIVVALGLSLARLAPGYITVAQAAEPEEVVSPLVATALASPNPVLGADDKVHLAEVRRDPRKPTADRKFHPLEQRLDGERVAA
jgi:hypothetical protein